MEDRTTNMNKIKLSKTLSHALRHEPWLYELELDDEGWTDIEAVLAAIRERPEWSAVAAEDVIELNQRADKRRFEIEGHRIRALYGHSIPGKLKRLPATPPEILYHGTNPQFVTKIRADGLKPMRRQFVHLSVDRETAVEVGRRKSQQPVIMRIQATLAHQSGIAFYVGNDKVWLADFVPPGFIEE
jgi:putative RNA 2'-phosphotransferase